MKNPFSKNESVKEEVKDMSDVTLQVPLGKSVAGVENTDDEYEYITPHYTANAVLLLLFSIIISAIVSFMVFNKTLVNETENYYIAQGYILTNDANATAADIVEGKTAYVRGRLITGTYVPMDSTLADATAADILEGYTAYAKGGKITGTISTYTGQSIITPGTETIKIYAGQYLTSIVSVSGSSSLIPENIRKDVTVFNIKGTYGN